MDFFFPPQLGLLSNQMEGGGSMEEVVTKWWVVPLLIFFFPLSSCYSFLVESQEITHPPTPTFTCCSLAQCQLILFPAGGDAVALLRSLPFPPLGNVQDLTTLHRSRKFIVPCRLFKSLSSNAKKKVAEDSKMSVVWEAVPRESFVDSLWDWPSQNMLPECAFAVGSLSPASLEFSC